MLSWRSPHGRALPVIGARTLVMGVLNATPDSFSDGGRLSTVQAVVDCAGRMIEAGADVLDLGGESTRPGAAPVSEAGELERVLPALAALRAAFPSVPISIDTYKAGVAQQAIAQGADIINDVWGLTYGLTAAERAAWCRVSSADGGAARPPVSAMAQTAAECGCPVILMHNRPAPAPSDGEFWPGMLLELQGSIALAQHAGVAAEQIWLDPGFGFGKTPPQNLELISRLARIVELGFPVLVGTSRKSTIGKVLGTSVDDRIEGTGATVVWAIQQGCHMVRVHDVPAMMRFVRMADALKAGLGYSEIS